MSYGKWIELYCSSSDDWSFYWSEGKKLDRIVNAYLAVFQQTPAGRAKIDGLKVPNDPMPLHGTHRQIIECLHRRADFAAQLEYRAGLKATDACVASMIWNGQLQFIPPTKEQKHAA